ncbi:DUF4148 domain-containing protein [Burkholderia pyrrocinia]
MNVAKLSTLLAAAALTMGGIAPTAFAQGKTRADVRQELVQAQHEGTIPVSENDYPPSQVRIERKKTLHNVSVHAGERAPGIDAHDNRLAAR